MEVKCETTIEMKAASSCTDNILELVKGWILRSDFKIKIHDILINDKINKNKNQRRQQLNKMENNRISMGNSIIKLLWAKEV